MKYGQIAGSKKVNYAIYRCFEHLCDKDQQRFVKKFREQPHDSDQIMHTFRELILGAYLSSRGFEARYEYSVDSEAPDWCVLNNRRAVIAIIELANFHIDAVTESEINKQMQTKGIAVNWRDGNKNNVERLYYCIWDKMQKYQVLVEKLNVPYIIAIFPDFKAATDFEEVLPCLHHNEFGLFQMYQDISGILYFEENAGQYSFRYEQNPNALRKFDLPGGVLSLVAEQER
jgi:hypothetical protein